MGRWDELRGRAVYEDEAVLVLDKPAGIAVMGERHDTDLVRLAAEAGETVIPVHRIDKATSGVILLAKELRFHSDLTRQFNKRTVDKAYLAITRSAGLPEHGTIELPLSVGRKNRVRVAANREDIGYDAGAARWSVPPDKVFGGGTRSYPSVTRFERLWDDDRHTLVRVAPASGRRHQIRVHLAWIGHPIEGDPLFDKRASGRMCLHAWQLAFAAGWAGGREIRVSASPGDDFWQPVRDRLPYEHILQAYNIPRKA